MDLRSLVASLLALGLLAPLAGCEPEESATGLEPPAADGALNPGSPATYDFALDRLEVAGNVPGGFVDDFDDGALDRPPTSEFRCFQPVTESAGVLRLSSEDGYHLTPGGLVDLCVLGLETPDPVLRDGRGDATVTAEFRADPPEDPGDAYGINLHTQRSAERASLTVRYHGSQSAVLAAIRPPSGPESRTRVPLDLTTASTILLRAEVADASDEVTLSYSLDGGQSFTTVGGTGTLYHGGEPAVVQVLGQHGLPRREASIDVKPNDDDNRVRIDRGRDVLPVAVLSEPGFDATRIDPESAALGDGRPFEAGVARRPNGSLRTRIRDVDQDGDRDLVLHFSKDSLVENGDLSDRTTGLILRALPRDGSVLLEGSDVIRTGTGPTAGAGRAAASGHGNLDLGGSLRAFSFSAHRRGNGDAAGHFATVTVHEGLILKAQGPVTCVTVRGDRAWIGAEFGKNGKPDFLPPRFTEAVFRVEDRGEPGVSAGDRISLADSRQDGGAEAYCRNTPDFPRLRPIESGNLQVR